MFSLAHLSTECYKKEGSEIKGKRMQGDISRENWNLKKKYFECMWTGFCIAGYPLKADSWLDNFIIREFEKCALGMEKDILIFCKCESKIK